MPYALLMLLAAAGSNDDCDLRAAIAGELMFHHQSGADVRDLSRRASRSRLPDFATTLLARVVAVDVPFDPEARELAAYHFAAEIHAECLGAGDRTSWVVQASR